MIINSHGIEIKYSLGIHKVQFTLLTEAIMQSEFFKFYREDFFQKIKKWLLHNFKSLILGW